MVEEMEEDGDAGLSRFGFDDLSLMYGERVEMSLDLAEDTLDSAGTDVLLLTDRRLMHLNGSRKNRMASMASVQDILMTVISTEKEGIGAFIWAGLSFFVGIMLWQVVNHPLGSAAAGIVLAMMGIYPIYDRLTAPGRNILVFKASGGEMKVQVRNEEALSQVDNFIHRIYELKEERSPAQYRKASGFALR